jgi:hypothetical protein
VVLRPRRPARVRWQTIVLLLVLVGLFGVALARSLKEPARSRGTVRYGSEEWYRLSPGQRLEALGSQFRRR